MRYTAEMVADRLEIEDLITDYAAIIDAGQGSAGQAGAGGG